jgi:hypothetical protein
MKYTPLKKIFSNSPTTVTEKDNQSVSDTKETNKYTIKPKNIF